MGRSGERMKPGKAKGSRVSSLSSIPSMTLQDNEVGHMLDERQRSGHMVKMMTVLLVPILALFGMTVAGLVTSLRTFKDAGLTAQALEDAMDVQAMVASLQKERDITSFYLSSHTNAEAYKEAETNLRAAQKETDKRYYEFDNWPPDVYFSNSTLAAKDDFDDLIVTFRASVWDKRITAKESIFFFTEANEALLDASISAITLPSNGELWPPIVALQSMTRAEECSGIQLAIGASFHTPCGLDNILKKQFSELEAQLKTFTTLTFHYYKASKSVYNKGLRSLGQVDEVVDEYKDHMLDPVYSHMCLNSTLQWRFEQGLFWINNVSVYTSVMAATSDYILSEITKSLDNIEATARDTMIIYCTIAVLFIGTCVILGVWYALSIYKMTGKIQLFARKITEKTTLLQVEKKKTEDLLYQMLPRSVAEKLRKNQNIEAEYFDNATIYFSDIVGFTSISARSSPREVCELLNQLYRMFDETIELYDVYKVETIGDAYMVVSGVPVKNGDLHAKEIALLSIHLLRNLCDFRIPHMSEEQVRLRIGLHSGPCAAGVVGVKMPRYCLFGDTVNTASRMESSGEAHRIHISETTKDLLGSSFKTEKRDTIEVKGKGEMTTYWVISQINEDPRFTILPKTPVFSMDGDYAPDAVSNCNAP